MDIRQQVYGIISEVFHIEKNEIKGDAIFVEDMGADSMDMLTIVARLERSFDTAIRTEDIFSFITPDSIVTYFEEVRHSGDN